MIREVIRPQYTSFTIDREVELRYLVKDKMDVLELKKLKEIL